MKTQIYGWNTSTTYSWDFESNLIGIDFPNTANDDSHEYDGMGRRMRSKFAGAANWTNYVWDEVAGTLLAEYTLISETFTIKSENTWGLGLISTNRESTKRYFHFDGMGNTVALTDASENITDTYGYTASGTSIASQDSGTSVNPYRWRGYEGLFREYGNSLDLYVADQFFYEPGIATRIENPFSETRQNHKLPRKQLDKPCATDLGSFYAAPLQAAKPLNCHISLQCIVNPRLCIIHDPSCTRLGGSEWSRCCADFDGDGVGHYILCEYEYWRCKQNNSCAYPVYVTLLLPTGRWKYVRGGRTGGIMRCIPIDGP